MEKEIVTIDINIFLQYHWLLVEVKQRLLHQQSHVIKKQLGHPMTKQVIVCHMLCIYGKLMVAFVLWISQTRHFRKELSID